MSSETPDQPTAEASAAAEQAAPKPLSDPPEELTPPQVAVLARATATAVHRAIKDGRLPARLEETRRGPVYLIRKSDAEAYAATVRPWPGRRPERPKDTTGRSG